MTPRQELGLRSARIHDDLLYNELVGHSLIEIAQAKSRLTEYFMSRVPSVSFEQRSALTEATMQMLTDMSPNELFALDKQYFPECYV